MAMEEGVAPWAPGTRACSRRENETSLPLDLAVRVSGVKPLPPDVRIDLVRTFAGVRIAGILGSAALQAICGAPKTVQALVVAAPDEPPTRITIRVHGQVHPDGDVAAGDEAQSSSAGPGAA